MLDKKNYLKLTFLYYFLVIYNKETFLPLYCHNALHCGVSSQWKPKMRIQHVWFPQNSSSIEFGVDIHLPWAQIIRIGYSRTFKGTLSLGIDKYPRSLVAAVKVFGSQIDQYHYIYPFGLLFLLFRCWVVYLLIKLRFHGG